ncbi:hypothetical protein [Aerococcus sp. HMSC10H05]|uniref:hypothetical protein n=1 Tax=Aerococcus sp. HMSC10H05 TaxID=1581084 RepID=UPI0008A10781|nr:hypothetical protein [Aerococcus sp. HMSC10H05]OFU49657.1 hypothetical protein HMPREF3116_06875 [Aerococcus sp. HMSC10H05]
MKKRFYPILGMVIFLTLLASLIGKASISMELVMGLMVFALMLASTLQIILNNDQGSHIQAASTTIIGGILAMVSHVAIAFTGFDNLLSGSVVAITGFVAIIGFIAYAIASFIRLKMTGKMTQASQLTFNKWTKGILIVSTSATLIHMLSFDFLHQNIVFMTLITFYFVSIVITFIYANRKQTVSV